MCNAFSAVVVRNGKVYWRCGMDGHNEIVNHFKLKDDKVGNICPIEITPENKNYINPNKWVFKFDEDCPDWWKKSHEQNSWDAHKKWMKEVYSKIHKTRIKNMVHPFKLPIKKVNKSQIRLLKQWASVGDSGGAFVWASVGDSVRASVWASVGASVWDSVGAYTGYMFKLKRNEWKYTSKIKSKSYPFISLVKLWKQGLVPSFDGVTWRLHSGKKAKIVYEISKKDLKRFG